MVGDNRKSTSTKASTFKQPVANIHSSVKSLSDGSIGTSAKRKLTNLAYLKIYAQTEMEDMVIIEINLTEEIVGYKQTLSLSKEDIMIVFDKMQVNLLNMSLYIK